MQRCVHCGTRAGDGASYCPRCGAALLRRRSDLWLEEGGLRSVGVAYGLWALCLVALNGIHRFYAGKPITGVLWLVTFGFLYIGTFIDLFLIPGMIERENRRLLRSGSLSAP